jgi:hypothetical protein
MPHRVLAEPWPPDLRATLLLNRDPGTFDVDVAGEALTLRAVPSPVTRNVIVTVI